MEGEERNDRVIEKMEELMDTIGEHADVWIWNLCNDSLLELMTNITATSNFMASVRSSCEQELHTRINRVLAAHGEEGLRENPLDEIYEDEDGEELHNDDDLSEENADD
jgi:hypothetical protein